jgi:hypothetical protein
MRTYTDLALIWLLLNALYLALVYDAGDLRRGRFGDEIEDEAGFGE